MLKHAGSVLIVTSLLWQACQQQKAPNTNLNLKKNGPGYNGEAVPNSGNQGANNGGGGGGAEIFLAPINDADILKLIEDDVRALSSAEQKEVRYFSLHVPSNAGRGSKDLDIQRMAFKKVINSLSTKSKLFLPEAIDSQKTVYRVNLESDLGIPLERFDEVVTEHYPYVQEFQAVGSEEDRANAARDAGIRQLTGALNYMVRMDWFNATALLPIPYTKLMGFDENVSNDNLSQFEEDFIFGGKTSFNSLNAQQQQLLDPALVQGGQVDTRIANILKNDVIRSAWEQSGVSQSNRMVERHETNDGNYWISYDFLPLKEGDIFNKNGVAVRANALDVDAHKLTNNPLGPLGTNGGSVQGNANNNTREFNHDGGEAIYTLPNGLFGFFLFDAAGRRLDKGPKQVVFQVGADLQYNQEITNGHTCMDCHNGGLLVSGTGDTITRSVLAKKDELNANDFNRITEMYQPEEYLRVLNKENEGFKAALETLGIPFGQGKDPVRAAWSLYNRELKKKDLVAELGITEDELETILESDDFDRQLGSPLQGDGVITRSVLQSEYQKIVTAIKQRIKRTPPVAGDFVVDLNCMAAQALFMDNCVIQP